MKKHYRREMVKKVKRFKRGDRVYELCIDTGRLVPNREQGIAKVEEEIAEDVYRIGNKDWFKDCVPGKHLQRVDV